MDHFLYRDGRLFVEGVPVETIACGTGTPVYLYSTATLERHYRVFARPSRVGSDSLLCCQGNGNIAVIATLARVGAGADVVSGGELANALAAGVPADRIVFSGIGKSIEEMRSALLAGVLQINVESEPELEQLRLRRPRTRSARTHGAARQPRCRCKYPRQDFDRSSRR